MKVLQPYLTPLEQRVFRDTLLELEATLRSRAGDRTSTLLALIGEHVAGLSEIERDLAEVRVQHARAHTEEERRKVLIRALSLQRAPARTLRAARSGLLDLDAYGERGAIAAHAHEVRAALCLRMAAATATAEEAPAVRARSCELLSETPTGVLPHAAAESLVILLSRADLQCELSLKEWECVEAPLRSSSAPRRVQSALLQVALRGDRARALRILRTRLLAPRADPDDFLLRQHFVVRLKALGRDPATHALLLELATVRDSSEHVRLSIPDALWLSGGADALPALASMIAVPPEGDPSHRVRAAAGLALIAMMTSGVRAAAREVETLLFDPDPRARRIVMEELERVAASGLLDEELARALSRATVRAAATTTKGELAEPALRLVEALAPVLDAELGAAQRQLSCALEELPPASSVTLRSSLQVEPFGRVMAIVARKTFGLYAEPVAGGYRITHGPSFVRRFWRILHELRARTPYKRQDHVHSIGRSFDGKLRAHPEQLAEATPTIPGEPLAITPDGSWGTHLPTVDDLLSAPLLGPATFQLFSARGVTTVRLPDGPWQRLRVQLQLSKHYVSLAADRNRALNPSDPTDLARYRERLAQLGVQLEISPYPEGAAPAAPLLTAVSRNFSPPTSSAAALAVLPGSDALNDGLRYLLSPSENTLQHLIVATALLGAGMIARNIAQRQRIHQDRESIPLVIGGWGTRGKSGTERLKAAMLHAQGVNVLVKTTGCEAMFIHGVPGRRPTEIFIHRSYDKATIWEQSHVLRLAARLKVSAFLWECMALSPPLVRTLQEEWMRDDLSTLTNAYPDHEDIQGPAGHDVAQVIAGFMRRGGTTLTSEEQMLPIFEHEARRKGARLITVARREHELLADDLLQRFPYNEHPRNIALVRRLAQELGLDPDLATADMADHVVPDLGVLKAYPPVEYRGRVLTFVNGMSANERTGFLSNWQRMGCEQPLDATVERGRWTVTVVNNRYDRVARSKVFADILVRDAAAERHVLIGTNLVGLKRYIEQALEPLLDELQLFQPGEDGSALATRIARMRHRLRIGPATSEALLQELATWTREATSDLHDLAQEAFAHLARLADASESLIALTAAMETSALAEAVGRMVEEELRPEFVAFLARSAARRALFASLERQASAAARDPKLQAQVNARQRATYRALFLESVVSLPDPGSSGDQVIDFITSAIPPGVNAVLMGTQNIKGTGLDFVYRFVRYAEVKALVDRLHRVEDGDARVVAAELSVRTDWGMLDARLATVALLDAANRFRNKVDFYEYLDNVATQVAQHTQGKLQAAGTGGRGRGFRRIVGKALDSFDAVRRRLRAEALLDSLVHQEISHERAALEARRLVDREKNGWL